MSQGSNMTRSHKGMRKGISLIELLMAIVLLGILSSLGFKYYKIYWDTTFAVKQAKMYLIIEQATYLSGAHDLFETKNASVPAVLEDMVTDKQLKEIPQLMPEIGGAKGWELKTYKTSSIFAENEANIATYYDGNITIAGVTADNDIAFTFDLNGTGDTSRADLLDYCNIINNTSERTWSLDSNITTHYIGGYLGITPAAAYSSGHVGQDFFCYSADPVTTSADYNLTVAFIKLVDPT